MRGIAALVPFLACFASATSATDALGERFVSALKDVCVSQVTAGIIAPSAEYEALSSEQRMVLAQSFGSTEPADGVWAEPSADWMILQQDLDQPEMCMFVSFRAKQRIVVDEWNNVFSETFRAEGPATVRATRDGARGGGFNSKPVNDGFVQVSVATFSMEETEISILTAIKVPHSSVSCDLWPEESDKCPTN